MAQIHIFAEREFSEVSRGAIDGLKRRIYSEDGNYLLNVNRTEYLDHVVSEFEIAPLGLKFDGITLSSTERMIPAEHFPFNFNVFEGESYLKPVVRYHIPFSGDAALLSCAPNPRFLDSRPVSVERGEVCFEIVDFYADAERIKRDAESIVNLIRQQAENLERNIAGHNTQVRRQAEAFFDARKAELMKQSNVLAALGVPVKRAANIADTFAVPAQSESALSRGRPPRPNHTSPNPRSTMRYTTTSCKRYSTRAACSSGCPALTLERTKRHCGIISS